MALFPANKLIDRRSYQCCSQIYCRPPRKLIYFAPGCSDADRRPDPATPPPGCSDPAGDPGRFGQQAGNADPRYDAARTLPVIPDLRP